MSKNKTIKWFTISTKASRDASTHTTRCDCLLEAFLSAVPNILIRWTCQAISATCLQS